MLRPILYLLAGLSIPDFEWLLRVGRKEAIAAGQTLIHEGKQINALYILLDGEMSVVTEKNGPHEIARVVQGDVVGEISFVDSRPPSATVTAMQDSKVWAIPRAELLAKLGQDNAFAAHFYESLAIFLADRLRHATTHISDPITADDADLQRPDVVTPKITGSIKTAQLRLQWLLDNL
jgi:CRP-like cAMP-binding protein